MGKQTVPRAELWASLMAASLGRGNRHAMTTLSDSAYFVNGADVEDVSKLESGRNGDLWEAWREECKDPMRVVRKIKGHAELQALRGEVALED